MTKIKTMSKKPRQKMVNKDLTYVKFIGCYIGKYKILFPNWKDVLERTLSGISLAIGNI